MEHQYKTSHQFAPPTTVTSHQYAPPTTNVTPYSASSALLTSYATTSLSSTSYTVPSASVTSFSVPPTSMTAYPPNTATSDELASYSALSSYALPTSSTSLANFSTTSDKQTAITDPKMVADYEAYMRAIQPDLTTYTKPSMVTQSGSWGQTGDSSLSQAALNAGAGYTGVSSTGTATAAMHSYLGRTDTSVSSADGLYKRPPNPFAAPVSTRQPVMLPDFSKPPPSVKTAPVTSLPSVPNSPSVPNVISPSIAPRGPSALLAGLKTPVVTAPVNASTGAPVQARNPMLSPGMTPAPPGKPALLPGMTPAPPGKAPVKKERHVKRVCRVTLLSVVNRQGLDNLEMADIMELSEDVRPESLIPILDYGLKNYDPDFFRAILKASKDKTSKETVLPAVPTTAQQAVAHSKSTDKQVAAALEEKLSVIHNVLARNSPGVDSTSFSQSVCQPSPSSNLKLNPNFETHQPKRKKKTRFSPLREDNKSVGSPVLSYDTGNEFYPTDIDMRSTSKLPNKDNPLGLDTEHDDAAYGRYERELEGRSPLDKHGLPDRPSDRYSPNENYKSRSGHPKLERYRDRPRSRSRSPRRRQEYEARRSANSSDPQRPASGSRHAKDESRREERQEYRQYDKPPRDHTTREQRNRTDKYRRKRHDRRYDKSLSTDRESKSSTCSSAFSPVDDSNVFEDDIADAMMQCEEFRDTEYPAADPHFRSAAHPVLATDPPTDSYDPWLTNPREGEKDPDKSYASTDTCNRWGGGILLKFLHQMRSVGPELVELMAGSESEGQQGLAALFDADVLQALPSQPREQMQFLRELQQVVSGSTARPGYDGVSGSRKRGGRADDSGLQAKRRAEGKEDQFHCRLCNRGHASIAEFDLHMHSEAHRARMGQATFMHAQQTETQRQRLLAQEHLRDIENDDSDVTCKVCVKKLPSPMLLDQHLHETEHLRRVKLIKKGCILCKTGSFINYERYKEHIALDSHKKAKEVLNRSKEQDKVAESRPARDTRDSRKASEDRGSMKASEDRGSKRAGEDRGSKKASEDRGSKRPSSAEQKRQGEAKVSNGDKHPEEETEKPAAEESEEMEDGPVTERGVVEEEVQGDLLYEPDVAVGQEHVIPVRGFFCKLCHKFYKNEELAKNAHCKSEKHFEKYQEYIISQQQEMDCPSPAPQAESSGAQPAPDSPAPRVKHEPSTGGRAGSENNPMPTKTSGSSRVGAGSKTQTARRGRRR